MPSRIGLQSRNGGLGASGSRDGRAFSVEDALLALRWASLVRPRGYRLSFCLDSAEADEVIDIHIPPFRTPIARIHRGRTTIWSMDCHGNNQAHVTLAEALLSVAALSAGERRAMVQARTPQWLAYPADAAATPLARLWRWLRAG